MKGIAKTVLAAVLAVGLAGAAHAQTASKKLVVYCPHPLVFIEPIVKKFEAATGIQTEVVAANITQTIGFHGFFDEGFEESVNGFFGQVFFEVQVQLETQLLKFINAQFFAQTLGTISSH